MFYKSYYCSKLAMAILLDSIPLIILLIMILYKKEENFIEIIHNETQEWSKSIISDVYISQNYNKTLN